MFSFKNESSDVLKKKRKLINVSYNINVKKKKRVLLVKLMHAPLKKKKKKDI